MLGGCKAGTGLREGADGGGREGTLTSRPPCQEDPLSLQPPVGTAGSLRPWALIQTVPTRSLWGDGASESKAGSWGGGESETEA